MTPLESLVGIRVYPNPVLDELNIFTDGNQVFGITLLGLDGKMSLKQRVDATRTEHTIQLSHLAKGVYVLRLLVEGANEQKLFKIIKR